MLRLKKAAAISPLKPWNFLKWEDDYLPIFHCGNPSQWNTNRFVNMFQTGSKEAIAKERARLKDEIGRGYFDDISEMKRHGGKIGMANKIIIPAAAAMKFPAIEVNGLDASTVKLPVISDEKAAGTSSPSNAPKASLVCLSFRASSQPMVASWSLPFLKTFGHYSTDIHLYEISLIDTWLLCWGPIKKLLLKVMRKPKPDEKQQVFQRQVGYYFGDHYYFRKELKIINLLTGYVFLLDKFGRIRWRGYGWATEDELASLKFCTSRLLEEE
ncbi:uncharacterized protein LOC127252431 [Andrographis paniculata]|uniref:uncharacterized protein LOC127252431 n=1 Tax=Andrographis paniculata TaxID=175694 RepID=UPI0021E87C72|nr:uncharacterized protein LOC127252431 [Andrographis paniculata]